ncbi:hypothetical protein Pth03_22110 [Planotetraspora thailandica]|uniref:Uncharacterized protein n=1 Tax=Planotetraspora thailandica TaxID=487172 RepID=A0A8J3UYD0_9ACTN|nr:hypothetical protein [Planotetraspora thailandica]GII53822.1 hypothetical protein Pth03_22110 [Planotetraspora thailandica]
MTEHDKENGGSGSRRQDPLGSAAEEAMKLFDALQQRVGRELGKGMLKGGADGLGISFGGRGGRRDNDDVWSEAVAGGHDDGYICRACPVCRVIAARKESGGDVADHLIAAGGELFAAMRQAFDAFQRSASPGSSGPSGASGGSGSAESPGSSGARRDEPRVEHIDLG